MAYDLIYEGLTSSDRTLYANRFVSWSNQQWANDNPAGGPRDDRMFPLSQVQRI